MPFANLRPSMFDGSFDEEWRMKQQERLEEYYNKAFEESLSWERKELEKDGFIPESGSKGGFMTNKHVSYSLPESVEQEKKRRKAITDKRKKERKNRKKNRK
jgi:hypothetical protein